MNIEQLKKTAKEKPQDKTFYYIKFVLNEICTNNNPLHSTDFFHFCFFCLLHVFQSSVLFNSFFATCLCLIYIIRLIFLFLSFFLLLCQFFLHLIGYSWSIPVLCSFSPVFFSFTSSSSAYFTYPWQIPYSSLSALYFHPSVIYFLFFFISPVFLITYFSFFFTLLSAFFSSNSFFLILLLQSRLLLLWFFLSVTSFLRLFSRALHFGLLFLKVFS